VAGFPGAMSNSSGVGILTENPILAKEMRARLRSRKQTKANRIASIICTTLVVGLLYYLGLVALFDTKSPFRGRDLYGVSVIGFQLTLLILITPSLAAGSITQEREQQTWNALLLSRLTRAEIVLGKYLACLLPVLAILALFVPIDIIAAYIGEIGILRFVASHLLLLGTALFYCAIGLYFSWASRRTFVATTASLSVIILLAVGTPLLYGLWEIATLNRLSGPESFPPLWLNPYYAMTELLDENRKNLTVGLVNIIVCFGGTIFLLWRATHRLAKGPKELEQ
jgi:ABC-type transport system involved in multi-copper enzyme maturation permease subunit